MSADNPEPGEVRWANERWERWDGAWKPFAPAIALSTDKPRIRVHIQPSNGFFNELPLEEWLNTLPGRLISVYWANGASVAVVEDEPGE